MDSRIREALEESTKLLGDILRTVETHREDRIKRVMCQNGAAISLLTAEPKPCESFKSIWQGWINSKDGVTTSADNLLLLKDAVLYASQVADKREEELRAENDRLTKRVADLEKELATPILVNTSRLEDQLATSLDMVETLREPMKQFDSWISTFNCKWRIASLIERLEMLDSLLSIQTKTQEALAATEPKSSAKEST